MIVTIQSGNVSAQIDSFGGQLLSFEKNIFGREIRRIGIPAHRFCFRLWGDFGIKCFLSKAGTIP